jgi:amino acid permease
VVATYIGVALYVILYAGYTLYQRFYLREPHFVPLQDVDLETDAVWTKGEGVAIREQESRERDEAIRQGGWSAITARFIHR